MADLFPESLPSRADALAELRREEAMREDNYGNFIRRGLLTKEKADLQMSRLRAAIHYLEETMR